MLNLDHIVISAESLLVGQEFIEDKLGVKADPGGEHPVFGTHNKLISFG
ncbi:MAG: VOC family protein, partial [Paracoccaceae bacterium]